MFKSIRRQVIWWPRHLQNAASGRIPFVSVRLPPSVDDEHRQRPWWTLKSCSYQRCCAARYFAGLNEDPCVEYHIRLRSKPGRFWQGDPPCVLTGNVDAHVHIEAEGTMIGGDGSRFDTEHFVWLRPMPYGVKSGDRLGDPAIKIMIARGWIGAFESMMNGPIPASPKVLKAAFAITRGHVEKRFAKLLAGEITAAEFLGRFLDTCQPPDVLALTLLDVLTEATTGKAPGIDEWLSPWTRQRALRNEIPLFDQEPDDAPLGGHQTRIIAR